jgi:hypothetical protein
MRKIGIRRPKRATHQLAEQIRGSACLALSTLTE